MPNILAMCRCGYVQKLAVKSLKWVRCARCGKAINLDRCPKKVALASESSGMFRPLSEALMRK